MLSSSYDPYFLRPADNLLALADFELPTASNSILLARNMVKGSGIFLLRNDCPTS
jgi:hypothetical protein